MFGQARAYLAKLQAQSAGEWMARCLRCGYRFPCPGIRVGAAGKPVKLMRCPRCERWRCCRVAPKR